MSQSTDFSALDSNFALPAPAGEWDWTLVDPAMVQNQGWPGESRPFTRLPDRAEALVRPPVWSLSRCSSGLAIEFTTDSPALAVQWRLGSENLAMNHMPATGVSGLDFYYQTSDGWRWGCVARPVERETSLVAYESAEKVERRFRMYLPLYNSLEAVRFGVRPGTRLEFHRPEPFAISLYGTSIVQGGCASRPGMGYSAILERRLGVGVQNLGFSGNGKAEPEMARLIGELNPRLFLIDCLPNMATEDVEPHLIRFLEILLESRPGTPVAVVDMLNAARKLTSSYPRGIDQKRAAFSAVRRHFEQSRFASRLTWISGDMLGGDDEGTVDGVHPTDVGFMRIGDHLANAVRHLI